MFKHKNKMPIQNSTKISLTRFAESQNFEVINNEAIESRENWILKCDKGHDEFNISIATIRQHEHVGSKIVCPHCKEAVKIQKFLDASNLSLTDGNLLECNSCALSYRYFGNYYRPFSCYCRLKTRKQERAFFEVLHETFPGRLAKEIPYAGSHKCDIALYLEDKIIYIEVDELSHLYSTKKRAKDREYERIFETNSGDNEYLYRIDDRIISRDVTKSLEDFLEYLDSL